MEKLLRKLRRWAHDGVRDANAILNADRINLQQPNPRREITCAQQQGKLDVYHNLLDILKNADTKIHSD